ncbi:MAG: hypothetical protein AB2825_17840 [Candidatus Thiodiazotropha endolucinida]
MFKQRGWLLQIDEKRFNANSLSSGNDLLVEVTVNLGTNETNETNSKTKTA